MSENMKRFLPGLAVVAWIGLLAGGCQDDLTSPTKGFLDVDTEGLENVEVFLDGESRGLDPGMIGPVLAGPYLVSVRRDGFVSTPAGAVPIEVQPAQTARVRFTLRAVEFGNVAVSAVDELTGDEITGAEILRKEGGSFVGTGLVTPAVLQDLAVGPLEVLVRDADRADGTRAVTVVNGETVNADVELGPLRKSLAEMFTYITCPNCPEAADSLQSLQATRSGRVFVIEWHTLENLPLFDERWLPRHDMYEVGVRWPGVVLQGGYADDPPLLVGSQAATLLEYRARADSYLAECEGDCDYALVAQGVEDASAVHLKAFVKWRQGAPRGGLTLRFVLVQREVHLGSRLFHDVPRNYHEQAVSFATPGEIQEFEVSLPIDPSWGHDPGQGDHLDHVVYLQSDTTLEILAVDGTS